MASRLGIEEAGTSRYRDPIRKRDCIPEPMTAFSNDFLQDLPPKDRRYDTPVAENLVFSVFPNGVKAWVHVYSYEGYVRRRTIGLFPEMDYAQAQTALNQSRRIVAVDLQQGGRRMAPRSTNRKQFTLLVAGAVLGGVAVALSARWLIGGTSPPATPPGNVDTAQVQTREREQLAADATASQNDSSVADTARVSAADVVADRAPVQAAINENLQAEPSGTTGIAGTELASTQRVATALPGAEASAANNAITPEAAAAGIGESAAQSIGDSIGDSIRDSIGDSNGESPVDAAVAMPMPLNQPGEQTRDEQLALATTGTAAESGAPAIEAGIAATDEPAEDNGPDNRSDEGPDTAADRAPNDGQQAGPATIAASGPQPGAAVVAESATESATGPAGILPEAAEEQMADLTAEPGQAQARQQLAAAAADGSPATPAATVEPGVRAQLTSGLANLEPIDTLGASLVLAPGETRRVYFFTEARGMTGARVTHRWQRQGVVVTELPFVVADDPWKIYSSKNILAEQDGEWQVSIVAEDGSVLAAETFQILLQAP
jgi:hypothetical protein